jgi:hypothetical protein
MNDFLAQLKRRQAAHEAIPEPKPVGEMNEDEISSEIEATKAEILLLNREALQAGREAVAEANPRPRFLPNKRRKNWR